MLGCFLFLGGGEKIHTGNWRKAKRIFLLKIGGKPREKECWDVFSFSFAVKRNLCWKLEENSERECWDFFAVKKNSKPRIEKLELASNDFFFLLQGRKEGASCCKEGRKGLLVDDE